MGCDSIVGQIWTTYNPADSLIQQQEHTYYKAPIYHCGSSTGSKY